MISQNATLQTFFYCTAVLIPVAVVAVTAVFLLSQYRNFNFPSILLVILAFPLFFASPSVRVEILKAVELKYMMITSAAFYAVAALYFIQLGNRYHHRGFGAGKNLVRKPSGEDYEKKVILTFDDGPSAQFTFRVLEILEEKGIKAAFFTVGQAVDRSPEIVKRLCESGMTVGVHSYSHKALPFLFTKDLASELDRCIKALEDAGCQKPVLFRPPWGLYNAEVLEVAGKKGLKPVLWNRSSIDWIGVPPERIIKNSTHDLEGPVILLLHDGHKEGVSRENTVAALSGLIDKLNDLGYKFEDPAALLSERD